MCETCSSEVEVVEDCSLIDDVETGSTKKLGRPEGLFGSTLRGEVLPQIKKTYL